MLISFFTIRETVDTWQWQNERIKRNKKESIYYGIGRAYNILRLLARTSDIFNNIYFHKVCNYYLVNFNNNFSFLHYTVTAKRWTSLGNRRGTKKLNFVLENCNVEANVKSRQLKCPVSVKSIREKITREIRCETWFRRLRQLITGNTVNNVWSMWTKNHNKVYFKVYPGLK